MTNRTIHSVGWVVFWLLAFFLAPGLTLAEKITLVPLVHVSGGYDDNVYYSRVIQESDYVATARPGFILDYDSELFNVRSRGSVEILRYLHNTHLNRENYYGFF